MDSTRAPGEGQVDGIEGEPYASGFPPRCPSVNMKEHKSTGSERVSQFLS